MLYLSTTQSRVATVTLYERCSNLVDPYFTWKLVNCDTNSETVFYQDDHSQSPEYYNSFTISVATYSGLTSGIINVSAGQYDYYVYEMSTPRDLDLSNIIGEVETGILIVEGENVSYNSFTQSDDDVIRAFENY